MRAIAVGYTICILTFTKSLRHNSLILSIDIPSPNPLHPPRNLLRDNGETFVVRKALEQRALQLV
jgi:hypothetical protein